MKVTVIAVISRDGYIAHADGTMLPVSAEDTAFLSSQLHTHEAHIMGSKTFLSMQAKLTPKNAHKRYILTRQAASYESYADVATFVFMELSDLLLELEKKDVQSVLILGGGSLYDACIQGGYADTIYLTVEPLHLHNGIPFLSDNIQLQNAYSLTNETPLNDHGTLLQTYTKK